MADDGSARGRARARTIRPAAPDRGDPLKRSRRPQVAAGGGGQAPPDLTAAVAAVARWLDDAGVRGALIGGVAVSAIARPRATRDVDVVVWLPFAKDWPALVGSMGRHGIGWRAGGSLEFALASRVLLLQHDESGVDVDLSFGALEIERDLVASARVVEESGLALPLPRAEHLVILKAVAGRPRDAADIEGLLEVCPDLDRAFVRSAVAEIAELLEAPEILTTLERLFAAVPPHR